jgi:hypothetical protein
LPGKFAAETVLREGRSGGRSPIRRAVEAPARILRNGSNGNGGVTREQSTVA